MKKHYIGAVYDLTQENFNSIVKQLEDAKNEIDRLTRQNNYWEEREMRQASCCYYNQTQNEKLRAALTKSNEYIKGDDPLSINPLVKENDELLYMLVEFKD